MSSSRNRIQSPSPPRCEERGLSPTVGQGHTPRKDTPKKRTPRLKCRNNGCRVHLTTQSSRRRHEASYCTFRQVTPSSTAQTGFPVPSHDELELNENQCRVCRREYTTIRSRKAHERDVHRIFEEHGRTFSPVRFPYCSESNPERPQSCPPTDQTVSPFVSPVRPTKRRRALSFSQSEASSREPSPSSQITELNQSSCESSFSESDLSNIESK